MRAYLQAGGASTESKTCEASTRTPISKRCCGRSGTCPLASSSTCNMWRQEVILPGIASGQVDGRRSSLPARSVIPHHQHHNPTYFDNLQGEKRRSGQGRTGHR